MRKLSVSGIVVCALVTGALFGSSLVSRAQGATRFEYLRLSPYSNHSMKAPSTGYRACVATTREWACRQFESSGVSDAALRAALATLGDEGWQLVSAVNDPPGQFPDGLAYLFKRQRD